MCIQPHRSTTIFIHMDDKLITSGKEQHALAAVNVLKARHEDLSVHVGDQHSYLGMMFDYDRKSKVVWVLMDKHIEDIIDTMWDGEPAASPAIAILFDLGKGSLLDRVR